MSGCVAELRARIRWRRAAARMIASAMRDPGRNGWGDTREALAERVEDGETFDVARIRAYCQTVVDAGTVEGDRLEGLGREGWAWRMRSRARTAQRVLDMFDGRCAWGPAKPQSSGCPKCSPIPDGTVFSMIGGATAVKRTGQVAVFILAVGAVAGRDERGVWRTVQPGQVSAITTCPSCRGTGRNLDGTLPPVGLTPQLMRRFADIQEHAVAGRPWPRWAREAAIDSGAALAWLAEHPKTREVPRGQHTGGERWIPVSTADSRENVIDLLPRWRIGELRHQARQIIRRLKAPKRTAANTTLGFDTDE